MISLHDLFLLCEIENENEIQTAKSEFELIV